MGSLIRRVTGISGIGYGVNILEVTPAGKIGAAPTGVIGIVGDFPWGPVNVVTQVGSTGEFFRQFSPLEFENQNLFAALKTMLNKPFPAAIQVCRIAPSSVPQPARSTRVIVPHPHP